MKQDRDANAREQTTPRPIKSNFRDWKVLAVSINQSQPRMRHSSFIADFIEKAHRRLFWGRSFLKSFGRVLQVLAIHPLYRALMQRLPQSPRFFPNSPQKLGPGIFFVFKAPFFVSILRSLTAIFDHFRAKGAV
jgi:hypothetical protein